MPRFVALLRGVNVGKGNRIAMADLRRLLEGLGYTEVATLLNSGNVVFSSAARSSEKHAACIAAALVEHCGLPVSVLVRSKAELSAALVANPMPPADDQHSQFLVAFALDAATLDALRPLQELAQPPERFVVGAEAAYLHAPEGLLKSRVGDVLLGKRGRGVTTRNWATVQKLAAMLDEG